jgi:hypothetical protein
VFKSINRLGDRLLQAVLPKAHAAAQNCYRGACVNHQRRICCPPNPCFYSSC